MMPTPTTSLTFFGIQFSDPVTFLTDAIIFFYCLFIALKLHKNKCDNFSVKNWSLFYFTLSLSSILGGINHVSYYFINPDIRLFIWLGMNGVSCLSTYFAVRASIPLINNPSAEKHYLRMAMGLMILFMVLAIGFKNFQIVKLDIGLSLLFVIITHYLSFRKNIIGSGLIFYGMLISVLTVIVHSLKLTIHLWFNYNDISHVIMTISLIIVYAGVRLKEKEVFSQLNNNTVI